jgi:hypothetical protein
MYWLIERSAFSAARSNAWCSVGFNRKAIKWLDRSLANFFGLPIRVILYV